MKGVGNTHRHRKCLVLKPKLLLIALSVFVTIASCASQERRSREDEVPGYARYLIGSQGWMVDCDRDGQIYVDGDSIFRFRRIDGFFLTHEEFCSLYR